jgi:transcriptional regulator with XRE-family HTH domain
MNIDAEAMLAAGIRRLRKQGGYSLPTFSKKVGMSFSGLSQTENCKTSMTIFNIAKIAESYEMKLSEFMEYCENAYEVGGE